MDTRKLCEAWMLAELLPEMLRLDGTVHNGYIAAFAYMGLFGAVIIEFFMDIFKCQPYRKSAGQKSGKRDTTGKLAGRKHAPIAFRLIYGPHPHITELQSGNVKAKSTNVFESCRQ